MRNKAPGHGVLLAESWLEKRLRAEPNTEDVMKRHTRKAPTATAHRFTTNARRRRKNYDGDDEFETLEFGPGDPHSAPDRAAEGPPPQA